MSRDSIATSKLEEDQVSVLNRLVRITQTPFVLSSSSCTQLLQPGPKSESQPPPRSGLGPNAPYHQLGPPIPRRPSHLLRHRPSFPSRCPHPVFFSGVLTMGSGFLTVNSTWERYIESAKRV